MLVFPLGLVILDHYLKYEITFITPLIALVEL